MLTLEQWLYNVVGRDQDKYETIRNNPSLSHFSWDRPEASVAAFVKAILVHEVRKVI